MLDLIQKMFGTTAKSTTTANGPVQDAHIALCVLLLEAAHADGECSGEEMDHIASTLTTQYGISQKDIDKLIDSGEHQRNDSVDIFRFTRYMNNNLTKDEKIAVMEAVWRVIHIDATLEAHEDHFAHKLANLLRLTHTDLINAKLRAKKQLY